MPKGDHTVKPKQRQHLMWFVGLDSGDESLIRKTAGTDYRLEELDLASLLDTALFEREDPSILWLSAAAWEQLGQTPATERKHLDLVPRILVLGADYTQADLEHALDDNFADVVKQPLTRARVLDVLHRAVETRNLYQDIYRMTREILLERELLTRKNDVLSFLVTFLTRAAESLDVIDILRNARESLALMLPVGAVHAATWPTSHNETAEANLFVDATSGSTKHKAWTDLLLEAAHKLSPRQIVGYRTREFPRRKGITTGEPEPGRVLLLPLAHSGQSFGALAVLLEAECSLGKDQAQALESAMNHLALALRNALLFQNAQLQADHDALTRVHNRGHFDKRLREELERHGRYSHPLTMLLLDLDHFKKINDTFGHQAGDEVLRTMADTIRSVVRSTDYVARYGGEEFVVLLPHTDEPQARTLAERLRKRMASRRVHHQEKVITATVSIGLATMRPGSLGNTEELLQQADRALYLAKANGRNIVCTTASADQNNAVHS